MTKEGGESTNLDSFDKSDKMMEIRNVLRLSANEGNLSAVISYESLGSTKEAIFIITLLEKHGYIVSYDEDAIIVKW